VIFRRIVQQCRDRLVLASAVVQDDGRDAHEVADVRCVSALARVGRMQLVRVSERVVEPLSQGRHAG